MPFKNSYRDRFDFAFSDDSDFDDQMPKKGESSVGKYVGQLWDDGKKYLQNSFSANKDFTRFGFATPEEFWDACSKLENGQHYQVYPSRNSNPGDEWKQELIDNEIQKQIRTKKNHITANWHDIVISPNIVGINDIFDQERKKTKWAEHVRDWVANAQTFGGIWIRSILDKTENPAGIADEMTCKPGSVVLTPEARSIRKIDGNWYAIHGRQVNNNWVKKNYPKIDLASSDGGMIPSFLRIDKKVKDYTHTKMFNMLEIFCDDDAYEEIPFDQGEFDERIGALMQEVQAPGLEAQNIQPLEEDNHKKYIKAYSEWVEEKQNFYNWAESNNELTPQDYDEIGKILNIVEGQLLVHEQMLQKQLDVDPTVRIPAGKRKKYPHGRYIVTINGVLAEDVVNPYRNQWRNMFHYLPNERVPERFDGRGDVEILWQDNKILDTMMSRFADDGLIATHKKPWFKSSEKKRIEAEGLSTDPTVPGYYDEAPPIFPTGGANSQYLESYNIVKAGIKESLSINPTSRGESNFSGESGAHAEALIQQNSTRVAGELNLNLNDVIEDIVECRIQFWKEFYTEPRPYTIDGQQVMLVLAQHLRQMPVQENGQEQMKDIGAIEVAVRPDSNFPNRDESEINMLTSLSNKLNEDGLPIIPSTMILDYISKKFPSLGVAGKYRKDSELMALGKQTMEQQQMQAEQQAQAQAQEQAAAQKQQAENQRTDPLEQVKRKVQNQVTTQDANAIVGEQQ
jgi:predicted nucleic acid-binding OB-fold protein